MLYPPHIVLNFERRLNAEPPIVNHSVREPKDLDVVAFHPPLDIAEWQNVGLRCPLSVPRRNPQTLDDALQCYVFSGHKLNGKLRVSPLSIPGSSVRNCLARQVQPSRV